MSKAKRILSLLKSGKSVKDVAKATKTAPSYVYYVRWNDAKKGKKKPGRPKKAKQEWVEVTYPGETFILNSVPPPADPVNHPPHYTAGGIETIDFIEAKDLNYLLGNVIKYIARAGKKAGSDPIQDLEKAKFYLNREINNRKGA